MVVVKLNAIAAHLSHAIVAFRIIHALLIRFAIFGDFDIRIRLFGLAIFVAATCNRGQKDVNRQGEKQHRERGEVFSAFAVENFNNHQARTGEQILEGEPNTAVLACESRYKVLENEAHRKASSLGILPTLGAEIPFELGAAVEAMGGFCLGFDFSLYFVLHKDSDLMGQR